MDAITQISLRARIIVFVFLWFIAGLICSIYSQLSLEEGEDDFAYRAPMTYLAPLYIADGLASAVVPSGYTDRRPSSMETIVAYVFIVAFIGHAAITLSRKRLQTFIIFSFIQVAFLITGVMSVLYYWHWDAIHMHG